MKFDDIGLQSDPAWARNLPCYKKAGKESQAFTGKGLKAVEMDNWILKIRPLIAIVVLFVAILILDFYVLPSHLLVSSLYAIPIMIAAISLPPRMVGAVCLVSIFLDLLTVWLKSPPITIWPYGALALIIVAYLGISLSRQLREVSRRAMEAEEARQRLQEFMGMAAHDLRGPLTTVLGYSQFLGKGREAVSLEASDKAIRAIEAETRQMSRLVNDLLDAARAGAGRFTVEPERMDLTRMARQVVEQQQATTTKHRIVLEAPLSLEGWWDPDRIAQVLTNLIANAIKYSPQGGEVRIHVERVNEEAVVRVSDQGVGLSREDIPLLFEPYSRLYREQPVKGAGLGLYISKAIVEAHGGRIWAESAGRGKGSTFIFTLPLSPDHKRGRRDHVDQL